MRAAAFTVSVFVCFLCLTSAVCAAEPSFSLSADSAILIDADSGAVLYEKNADQRRGMASTTKIMTTLVALENSPLTRTVRVAHGAVGVIGSSIYLNEGDSLSLEELLYAVMLESANDAAAAVAIEVSGSVEAFASLMNDKAAELGLLNTHFTNPHGLFDDSHYTTARDLAALTAYALKNPKFREITSTYKKTISLVAARSAGGDGGGDGAGDEQYRLLVNHNRMLLRYQGAIGVKTGYTVRSGRCLVTAAERDGLTLAAVTLDAPDDWNDHEKMLDYGFSAYEKVSLSPQTLGGYTFPVVGGVLEYIKGEAESGSALLEKGENNITAVRELKRFYYAPIKKGEILGQVIYYNNGREIARIPVKAAYGVERRIFKSNLLELILDLFRPG